MLRISANLGFLWKGLPLVEAVRRAKAAGFDAVEFHTPYEVPAETMTASLERGGLPAVGLNTSLGNVAAGEIGMAAIPGREAEARAAIDEALVYADAIGAGYIQVIGGKVKDEERAAARKTLLGALEHASRGAEPLGIDVLIEPLNPYDVPGAFLNHTELAASIIGELGRPNVKILFDCYHVQIVGGRPDAAAGEADADHRPHPDRRRPLARRAGRGRDRLRPAAQERSTRMGYTGSSARNTVRAARWRRGSAGLGGRRWLTLACGMCGRQLARWLPAKPGHSPCEAANSGFPIRRRYRGVAVAGIVPCINRN